MSDIALCQRCPALLAYKIHRQEKYAWRVGIQGNGDPYGRAFHENIARVFFEAAANPHSRLYAKISASLNRPGELESVIRENIFLPFVASNSERYSAGQITAMARGVAVWVRAMSEVFAGIPSLMRSREQYMHIVFIPPEQDMTAHYNFAGVSMNIKGRYDALLFNPDKAEARLFEFKGYRKSDITVPLSQSLIYSWLLYKNSGVVPSVEIIYLDEEEISPDVFDARTVRDMIISGLPGLFRTVHDVITLRKVPDILRNKNLCRQCRYNQTCDTDCSQRFRRRPGVSLVSVLVFMLMASVLTAQVFFFSELSNKSLNDDRELLSTRLVLDKLVNVDRVHLVSPSYTPSANCNNFYSTLRHNVPQNNGFTLDTYNLNYTLSPASYTEKNANEKIFASMPPENDCHYFLIRAYKKPAGSDMTLMYQVLVKKHDTTHRVTTLSHSEIWY